MIERKHSPIEIKAISDEGVVEGYASVWGDPPDTYGDVVVRGAFLDSLKQRTPAFLWQHDERSVIGGLIEAKEDDYGLWTRWQVDLDIPNSADAFRLMKRKRINGLSIGFVTEDAEYGEDDRRFLKKVQLWEVSAVTFPAAERAKIGAVKSDLPTDQLCKQATEALRLAVHEAKALHDRRADDGRALNDRQRDAVEALVRAVEAATTDLAALVTSPEAKAPERDPGDGGLAILEFELELRRLRRRHATLPATKEAIS